jgi:DNA repair and recombination protein RAD52
MTLSPEQQKMLESPLDPKHVKKPSGSFGPKGDYLEGWHVINELNRVFGFDGWSYSIDLSKDALVEGKDSKGQPQWQAAYTCVCTLTVGAVSRQDVGFGSGFAKMIGDAVEGATKEAATDALKRCARTFGNIFGLALYDKSRANVQSAPAELADASMKMIDAIDACETIKALEAWLRDNEKAARASPDVKALIARYNAREAEILSMDRLAA